MDDPMAMASVGGTVSRFELAPPRRFVLPAVLLLLSERPGYGYELVDRLADFHFGRVDRPAVYRALAQLEGDGLARASSESGTVGQARRVYQVTSLGERVLRAWMSVIKEEHDSLGQVLRRYQATGTADAVLAEVEGGWASALSSGWSPVSSTLAGHRRLVPVDNGPPDPGPGAGDRGTAADGPGLGPDRQGAGWGPAQAALQVMTPPLVPQVKMASSDMAVTARNRPLVLASPALISRCVLPGPLTTPNSPPLNVTKA